MAMASVLGANSGHKAALIKNDQAIFRLGGQVYFLSDIKETQRSLGILSCTSGDVLLDKYLDKSWKELRSLKLDDELSLAGNDHLQVFMSFVSLERLKNSVLNRGKDSLNQSELKSLGKKCGSKNWDGLKVNDKAILLIEVYLRDRFSKADNIAESLSELKKGLKLKDKHEFFSLKPSREMVSTSYEMKNRGQEKDQEVEKEVSSAPESGTPKADVLQEGDNAPPLKANDP